MGLDFCNLSFAPVRGLKGGLRKVSYLFHPRDVDCNHQLHSTEKGS